MTHPKSMLSLESSILYAKVFSIVCISFFLTTHADAIPVEIAAVKAIGDKIIPYIVWLFALGGGAIASINGWRLFNGQPKAGVYALGGMVTSGLGFNGIFGEAATTLLI